MMKLCATVRRLEARLTRTDKAIAVEGNVPMLSRELSIEGAEPKPKR